MDMHAHSSNKTRRRLQINGLDTIKQRVGAYANTLLLSPERFFVLLMRRELETPELRRHVEFLAVFVAGFFFRTDASREACMCVFVAK
jgi:hypothetical protein